MKLLTLYKESFIAHLQPIGKELVRVQGEISKLLWPERRDTPKRKVAGYHPKGYIRPKSLEERIEEEDIRDDDYSTGYSAFSTMSPGNKTRYIFKKYLKDPPPLIVPGPKKRCPWYVPCYSSVQENLQVNVKANRYLAHQYERINVAIKKGDLELSTKLWVILAQRSKAYRISALNSTKCTRGWYFKISSRSHEMIMDRVSDILRRWSCNVKYFRVYIPKADKIRFRPLGVPSKAWSIVLHMIYSYLVLVINSCISQNQFGFLPKRNGVQAWRQILENRKKGYVHMYEFDLEACFNRISVAWTLKLLSQIGLPDYFVYYLEQIITALPIAQEVKDERELQKKYQLRYIGDTHLKPTTVKSGLPQGFNISPLLSILVIDSAFKAIGKDPILYADDGIIMSKTKDDLTEDEIDMLGHWGLFLSKKKKANGEPSCRWIEDEFKFLGIEYSISRGSFKRIDEHGNTTWIKEENMKDSMFWEDFELEYSLQPEWTWDISPDCYALKSKSITSKANWKLLMRWVEGSPMVQRCGLLFLDVQKESSICSARMLNSKGRRTSRHATRRLELKNKYVVPLIHRYRTKFVLPTLDLLKNSSSYRLATRRSEIGPNIRQPMSLWLRIDLEQREHLYNNLYGWYTWAETNISMWREDAHANPWSTELIETTYPSGEKEYDTKLVYFPEYNRSFWLTENLKSTVITNRQRQEMWDEYERERKTVLAPQSTHKATISPRKSISSPSSRFKDLLTCFVVSFILSFFILYRNNPGHVYASEQFIPPSSYASDWIWWVMIILLTMVVGTIWLWYIGVIVVPQAKPTNESLMDYDRSLEILRETNNHLTNQVYELGTQLAEYRSENITLTQSISRALDLQQGILSQKESFQQTIEALQHKLTSVANTLTVVRQENINLNKNLTTESVELVRSNKLIEITSEQVKVLLDYLNRLNDMIDTDDSDLPERISQASIMLKDSPILRLLEKVSQHAELDITSATLIRNQAVLNGDDLLVFADESSFGAIMDGLSHVHAYIENNPFT